MREYPAWVGRDGLPLSWPLYCYGMSRLPRLHALVALRDAEIGAVAFAGGDAWDTFNQRMRKIAEV